MYKINRCLLCLLAVLALSAAATATAFAETHIWIIEGTELSKTSETEAVEGTSRNTALEAIIIKLNVNLNCNNSQFVAPTELEGGNPGKIQKGKIEFKDCLISEVNGKGSLESLDNCVVKEPVVAEFTGELSGPGELKIKGSGKEELFSEFEIIHVNKEASCALEGKEKIVGSQLCASTGNEIEEVNDNLECPRSGTKLKVGGESAALLGENTLALDSGDKWSSS